MRKPGKLGENQGKDLSRLPPRVLLPGGERSAPTEAGAETGAWTQPTGLQAPTTRTAGGPAGAPRCQILPHTNEKSQVSHKRYLTFLAGAEGLEPSARGFGVDVGTNHQERERAGVSRFLPQARKRAVLVWCCEVFWQAKAAVKLLLLEGPPPRGRTRIARRGPGQCRRLGRGFRPNPRQLCR